MTLNFTNITSPVGILTYVNNEVKGGLGIGIIISLFIVLFISFRARGYADSISAVASAFPVMITSILLLVLGMIHEGILIITVSIFIASFLWVSFERR
jgi:hypothetical protein